MNLQRNRQRSGRAPRPLLAPPQCVIASKVVRPQESVVAGSAPVVSPPP
jgi:hypothetical protein